MANRRSFLRAAGAGALAAAFPAASQSPPRRIVWTSPTKSADGLLFLEALRQGLREVGYVEGRNLILEPFWGEDSPQRIPAMIAEAIASRPHLIVAQGSTAPPVSRATKTIPVVFGYSGDPIEAKLVESLSRPGGNLTGLSFLALDLVGKRIELVKEMLPGAQRIAVLANPQHPGDQGERRVSQAAATALGLGLEYFEARNVAQLAEALAAIGKSRSDAVVMFPVQNIISNREKIAAWAIQNRLPAVSGWAQFAEGGNLMSYGPNLRDVARRLAGYADRILKGARPAELPVELPTRFELVINLKAAKALGVAVPRTLLLRADQVID